jgi:hypothetical protein
MDFKSIIAKLKPKPALVGKKSLKFNQSMVLWAVTGAVLLADLWALQSSLLALYRVRFEDVGAREVESTRVNFPNYKKATERVQKAGGYVPESVPSLNPFKEVPKQSK